MSEKIKYGETYESLAKNIGPYLSTQKVPGKINIQSLYPIWWDRTITIYNRYENATTQLVQWHKNILYKCFSKSTATLISGGQTTYNTDNNIIRIPQSNRYKPYSEWINIPNTEQPNYFTLHQGDIIIMGEVDDVINEYKDGMRSSDLISKYKELGMCLTIDAYQDNTGVGRTCPHYFVSGE